MGFCTIPKALIKRYAFEMNQNTQLVSNSMENERLVQLEKSGKLGVTMNSHKLLISDNLLYFSLDS